MSETVERQRQIHKKQVRTYPSHPRYTYYSRCGTMWGNYPNWRREPYGTEQRGAAQIEMQPPETQAEQKAEDAIHDSAAAEFGEEIQGKTISEHSRTSGIFQFVTPDGNTGEDLVPKSAGESETIARGGNRKDENGGGGRLPSPPPALRPRRRGSRLLPPPPAPRSAARSPPSAPPRADGPPPADGAAGGASPSATFAAAAAPAGRTVPAASADADSAAAAFGFDLVRVFADRPQRRGGAANMS
ncbi:unnamed protein product [Nesidiocoris tenuis]|uniref:Uncharacterized protein n=1 Tax=Nesidiocoris tenuis TaxID=355587 RepID=A0A6H5GKE6_9HEMI|nr:unnamed protein product [Nesidiocoris tenuis]